MSVTKMVNVSCPRCRKQGEFEAWQAIDATNDPDMKAKVISGDMFVYTCPDCGTETFVDYGFSYHETEANYMINVAPKEEMVKEALEAIASIKQDETDEKMKTCRIRVVRSVNQLKEKIKIYDANLDDRVIELVKYFVKETLMQNDHSLLISELLFNQTPDGRNLFLVRLLGGQCGTVPYKYDLYAYMQQKIEEAEGLDQNYIFDADWAAKFSKTISVN